MTPSSPPGRLRTSLRPSGRGSPPSRCRPPRARGRSRAGRRTRPCWSRPGSLAEPPDDPLQPDERRRPVGPVAHEPLDHAPSCHVARERSRHGGPRRLRPPSSCRIACSSQLSTSNVAAACIDTSFTSTILSTAPRPRNGSEVGRDARDTLGGMAKAPALIGGFELPAGPRLPRIGAVDAVALEERAATLAKRSIKRESKAGTRARYPDDGPDDARGAGHAREGGRAVLEGDAAGSADATVPAVAAVCLYPNLVAVAKERLGSSGGRSPPSRRRSRRASRRSS